MYLAQLDAHAHRVPAFEGVGLQRDDRADGVELVEAVEGAVVERRPARASTARHRLAVPGVAWLGLGFGFGLGFGLRFG